MNFYIDIKDLENQIEQLKKEYLELGRIINPVLEKYDLKKKEEL